MKVYNTTQHNTTQHNTTQHNIRKLILSLLSCFVFFSIAFSQNNCPGSILPNGCSELQKTATIDIATLWGSTGCPTTFTYTERTCPGSTAFEVFLGNDFELKMTNSCALEYAKYRGKIISQGQAALDNYVMKEWALMTNAALQTSALSLANTSPTSFNCAIGGFLTGRFYEGPCSYSCTKVTLVEHKYVVKTTRIVCGSNCCLAVRDFCLKNAVLTTEGPTKYVSVDKADCTNNPLEGCTGGPFTFKSSCLSSCALNQSAKIAPKFDDTQINTQTLNSEKLTVFLANNSSTKLLGITFANSFYGKVGLYDMSGREIYSASIAKQEETSGFTIDTANFPVGIYAISFQDSFNNVVTEKIIIK